MRGPEQDTSSTKLSEHGDSSENGGGIKGERQTDGCCFAEYLGWDGVLECIRAWPEGEGEEKGRG